MPRKPKGAIRRSQLITTYGIGSIIAVEDESFMVAGIDRWDAGAAEPSRTAPGAPASRERLPHSASQREWSRHSGGPLSDLGTLPVLQAARPA